MAYYIQLYGTCYNCAFNYRKPFVAMNTSDVLVLNRDMQPITLLPISSIEWQDAIKAVYLNTATIIHEYDDWEVHSPSMTMNVPSVVMVKNYVHFSRNLPWNGEYVKLRDQYRCQYCGKIFPSQKLTLDHVIPRKYGGKTSWDNIVSACAPCNHSRGHNQKIQPRIQPYKPSYWELIDKIKKLPLVVPDNSWVEYLNWPSENIIVKEGKKKILHSKLTI